MTNITTNTNEVTVGQENEITINSLLKEKASEIASLKNKKEFVVTQLEESNKKIIEDYKKFSSEKKKIEKTLDERIEQAKTELLDMMKTVFEKEKEKAMQNGISVNEIKFNQDDCYFSLKEEKKYKITNMKKFVSLFDEATLRKHFNISERETQKLIVDLTIKTGEKDFFTQETDLVLSHTVKNKEE